MDRIILWRPETATSVGQYVMDVFCHGSTQRKEIDFGEPDGDYAEWLRKQMARGGTAFAQGAGLNPVAQVRLLEEDDG